MCQVPSKAHRRVRELLHRYGHDTPLVWLCPVCSCGRGFVNWLTNVGTVLGATEYESGSR